MGTAGAVKAMPAEWLEALDARIILANTYHLYLRPGHERIARLGGLHRFMSWKGAILTDSGGYQVYSHRELRRIEEARRPFPIASGRERSLPDAGEGYGYPAGTRLGHSHGV